MNEYIARKFIENVCSYFEKKLAKETGNLWMEEINNIPEESLDYISAHIKRKESFPRNFPATCWAMYYQWLKDNPAKLAVNNCPDCEGKGWISDGGKAYQCGSCNREPITVNLDIVGFSGQAKVKVKRKPF